MVQVNGLRSSASSGCWGTGSPQSIGLIIVPDFLGVDEEDEGLITLVVAVIDTVATGYAIKKVRRSRTLLPTLAAHYPTPTSSSMTHISLHIFVI